MSKVTYTFPSSATYGSSAVVGNAPFTVVLQPSAINYGGASNFVSSITYSISGAGITTESYTRNYTYCSLQNALTGANKDIDSRSNFEYTFYNSLSGQTVRSISVSAVLLPIYQVITYTVYVYTNSPWLTKNPLVSGDNYVFENVHLLKNRSWGRNNEQIILAEGINGAGQVFFLHTSDSATL